MTIDEARKVLNTNYLSLAAWWGEFIDPSGTARAHDDPMVLAEEALDTFVADWEELVETTKYTMDDVFDALEIAAQRYCAVLSGRDRA